MRARDARREQTRALILASARKLFLERGYAATTIRDVASCAQRTTGSVFSLYESKEALFKAAMGRPAPDVGAFLESLIGLPPPTRDNPIRTLAEIGRQAEQLKSDLYGIPK